jgi:hypothetical protein
MTWIEKHRPTPLDYQPVGDGDLIVRSRPGIGERSTSHLRGCKYPLIHFPSGIETDVSIDASTGEVLLHILQEISLPYRDTADRAYEHLTQRVKPHWLVIKRGEDSIELMQGNPSERLLITYDNDQRIMTNVQVAMQNDPLSSEHILAVKDELLARFEQLPPEHQATICLVMVRTILEGEWGDWLRNALAMKVDKPDAPYIPSFFNVSRDDLRRVDVSEEDIDLLSDTDLTTIASLVHEHYITDAIWDEIAFITDLVLAGKRRTLDHAPPPLATHAPITPHHEQHRNAHAVPVSWLTQEDLLHARPDLKDKIAALGSADLAHLADKVSDGLQETYLLTLGIVLDTYVAGDQNQSNI